ncbi:leucine-rich repeat-containing protein 27-like isoform X2 [Plodia interpunctella]|uniref:leucine-rich repeat-containing protein 27-like isoform X2 n=1 Tax=Plodia interpunctella TaxID=58824 RepID=UPI0023686BFC|nr:leucine-rich repeat-containing protein 27-like isoform X2 [Plodia interpunctella]
MSEVSIPTNIYEEVLTEETICDLSSSDLETVLYLQNNRISELSEDFFPSLPSLMWLDLRNNCLTNIPKSIQTHPSLTHLLLQNNKLTALPDELGTLSLKVLQLNGNPITYPPKEIINEGTLKILSFLNQKCIEKILVQSPIELSEDGQSTRTFDTISQSRSYNSVLDRSKIKEKSLSVILNDKEVDSEEEEYYEKIKGKCPKLAKSRYKSVQSYTQSSKYVDPPEAESKAVANFKIKQNYLKDLAIKKHKDLLAKRDKILQDRKNIQLLQNWRREYRIKQHSADGTYKLEPKCFPYDTNPEYMTFLTREDIEKDLPDKYKRKLVRRCKPTVPRKSSNDVHLAIKIKQLFENLEAIDLNRSDMTPRTEQKVLLNEIQKITEIKQKLMELSSSNAMSVIRD